MNTSTLVQKVWNFCHTLRDDGVSYGDYLEQLTYLLFLKLAHEYAQEPYNRDTHIPQGFDSAFDGQITPLGARPGQAQQGGQDRAQLHGFSPGSVTDS